MGFTPGCGVRGGETELIIDLEAGVAGAVCWNVGVWLSEGSRELPSPQVFLLHPSSERGEKGPEAEELGLG